jgi:5-methylthioadenosine/S-adenosylhomocysteine deaminase
VLLRNATYLDEQMRFRRSDIQLAGGNIASISPPGTTGSGTVADSFDCSGKLVIPGLVNAHFHSQANLGRGLFKGTKLQEWGSDASEQGRQQNRFFELLDSGLTDDEIRIVCAKAYAELIRLGATFVQDSGLGERPARILSEAMNQVRIRGIVDAYDEIEGLAVSWTGA